MKLATRASEKGKAVQERDRKSAWWRDQSRALHEVEIPPIKNKRRRRKAEQDIKYALKSYFPLVFYNPFTEVHDEMIDAILNAIKYGGDHAVAAPRGEGKTSVFGCVAIIAINFGLIKYPVLMGATGPDAQRTLDTIKAEYQFNDALLEDFPEICAPIRALEGDNRGTRKQTVNGKPTHALWGMEKIVLPAVEGSKASNSVIEIRSPGSAIRGIYHRSPIEGTLRPDLVLIDDIETRKSAASTTQRDFAKQIIEGDCGGLAAQSRRISRVMLCTVWNRESISFQYTDPIAKPSWGGKRYKLVQSWPDRMDLWERYIQLRRDDQARGDKKGRTAFKFYLDNRKEMDRGVKVSNPARFISDLCPDGTHEQVSAIQFAFDFICDHADEDGDDPMRFFAEEFQNDPPALAESDSGLTANMVQHKLSNIPKGIVPHWAKVVTAFIDIGKYTCHWVVVAWGYGAKGVVIDYGVTEIHSAGSDRDEAIEAAIFNALQRWREDTDQSPYRDEEGSVREIGLALIDSGYYPTPVYRFCASSGLRFRASKGFGESIDGSKQRYSTGKASDHNKVGHHWRMTLQDDTRQWLVCMDTDYWKRWVHDRFLSPTDRPGSISLFGDDPYTHFSFSKHMVAEKEVEEFDRHGKGLKRFWKKIHRNNHYFDGMYGAACAAAMMGISILQSDAMETISTSGASEPIRPRLTLRPQTRPDGRPLVVPMAGRNDGRRWLDR